jgi:DNA-binding GntR family transcriptional regulator
MSLPFKPSAPFPKEETGGFVEELQKIKRPETLLSLAYDKIKGLLVSGQLNFEEIYSANQFAEMLGVSRTPVREALLQLAAEGLLIPVQGRGFKIKGFSEKEVKDFFEARLMIETYVIGRLVKGVGGVDVKALQASLKQMVQSAEKGDMCGFLEADKAFHMNLIHRYTNRLLESIMENIRNLISILGQRALSSSGRIGEVLQEHQAILEAVKARDANKAAKAMSHHLNRTEKTIIETL